jgi:hypothetical protein
VSAKLINNSCENQRAVEKEEEEDGREERESCRSDPLLLVHV